MKLSRIYYLVFTSKFWLFFLISYVNIKLIENLILNFFHLFFMGLSRSHNLGSEFGWLARLARVFLVLF